MRVAQCDNDGYFLFIVEDFNQGLPSNCFPIIPVFIDKEKEAGDTDGWYIGYHPKINDDWTDWTYVKSYKHQTGYIGSKRITIKKHYLEDGVTLEPVYPTDVLFKNTLNEKRSSINNARLAMLHSGIIYNGFVFQSSSTDREIVKNKLEVAKITGWIYGDNYKQRTVDNLMVNFSYINLQELFIRYDIQSTIIYDISFADKDKLSTYSIETLDALKQFVPTILSREELNVKINEKMNSLK